MGNCDEEGNGRLRNAYKTVTPMALHGGSGDWLTAVDEKGQICNFHHIINTLVLFSWPQRKGRKMEHEHHDNKDLEDMKRKKLRYFIKCRPIFKIGCALLSLHTKTKFQKPRSATLVVW